MSLSSPLLRCMSRYIAAGVGIACALYLVKPARGGELPVSAYQAIRDNESALLNLEVKSSFRTQLWDNQTNSWKPGNECKLVTWFTGAPGSKVRTDVEYDKTPWVGGTSAYKQDSYSMAYNGRIGQRLMRKQGNPDRPVTQLRGEVETVRPASISLHIAYASGWSYSVWGALDTEGIALSRMLSPSPLLRTEDRQFAGRNVLAAVFGDERNARVWFLDPTRNWALVGGERAAGKVVRDRWRVTSFQELLPGCYYPTAVEEEFFDGNGKLIERASFEASEAKANTPGFSDDIFTIHWPDGTVVWDRSRDLTVIIGMGDRELIAALDEQASAAKRSAATAPAPQLAPTAEPLLPVSNASSRPWLRWLIGAVCFAVALASYWAYRSRRKGAAALLLALCFIPSSPQAQVVPTIEAMGKQKVDNCAVNACAFISRLYDKGTIRGRKGSVSTLRSRNASAC